MESYDYELTISAMEHPKCEERPFPAECSIDTFNADALNSDCGRTYDPLDIAPIEIKEEVDDDMIIDLFDSSLQNCGQVLFLNAHNFVYVCTFCMMRFNKHTAFVSHLQKSHIPSEPVGNDEESDGVSDHFEMEFGKEEIVEKLDETNNKQDSDYSDFDNNKDDFSDFDGEDEKPLMSVIEEKPPEVLVKIPEETPTPAPAAKKPKTTRGKKSSAVSNFLPDQYPCEICHKLFKSKNYLKIHLELHTDNGTYTCESCGAEFSKRYNLQQHMHRHRQEKHFPCTDCEKVFRTKLGLTLHTRTHTGERPYVCDICGFSFVSINGLKDHKAVHENLRQYKCDICGKGFNQKRSLTEHRKSVHATEKNFICNICGCAYPSNTNLRKHQKIHEKNAAKKA